MSVEEIDLDSSTGGVESTDGKSTHSDILELEPKYFNNATAGLASTQKLKEEIDEDDV